jgi:hypothetical protein
VGCGEFLRRNSHTGANLLPFNGSTTSFSSPLAITLSNTGRSLWLVSSYIPSCMAKCIPQGSRLPNVFLQEVINRTEVMLMLIVQLLYL